MRTYLSIDNGVSGSICVLDDLHSIFIETPSKKEQSYTKKKQDIERIDYPVLYSFIYELKDLDLKVLIERPCVNPGRFKTTMSAMRSLEATMIVLENLGLTCEVIDSRQWQSVMIPNIKGSDNLKKASKELGIELFPQHKELITKHKDADALLISEWARRSKL